jgi:excisionase family DNA binding protein
LTKDQPDITAWLTKPEAAAAIGVSAKMIEKYAAAHKLQQAMRAQQGRRSIVVYHPDDVEQIRRERQPAPKPFVVPAEGNAAVVPRGTEANAFLEALARLLPSVPNGSENHVRWLTIAEAHRESRLSKTYLRRAIAEGKLAAVKDGRSWKIHAKVLEEFRG